MKPLYFKVLSYATTYIIYLPAYLICNTKQRMVTLLPVSTKYQLSTQFIEVCQPSDRKVLFNARPEETLKVNHIGLRKYMGS